MSIYDYQEGTEYIILKKEKFVDKQYFRDIAAFLGLPVYASVLYVGVNRKLLDYRCDREECENARKAD